jgi:hypothetical protein
VGLQNRLKRWWDAETTTLGWLEGHTTTEMGSSVSHAQPFLTVLLRRIHVLRSTYLIALLLQGTRPPDHGEICEG